MADEEEDPDLGSTTTTKAPKKSGGKKGRGARATLTVDGDVPPGTVDRVLRASGGEGGPGGEPGAAPVRVSFERAIKNSEYRIVAKRVTPQTLPDGTPLGDEYELMPHDGLSLSEIKQDISTARGGKKWIVRVLDFDDKVVVAQSIVVGGDARQDPLLDEMAGGSRGGHMPGEYPPGYTGTEEEDPIEADKDVIAAKKQERILEIQARQEVRRAELEEAQQRRRVASGDTTANNGHGKEPDLAAEIAKAVEAANAPLKEQLAEYKRKEEDRQQRDDSKQMMEGQTGPLKAMLESQQKTLEALTTKLNEPPKTNEKPIADQLDLLKRDLKDDTNNHVDQVVNGIKGELTGKIDALTNLVNSLMTRAPQDGGMAKEAVTALTQIATKGGPAGGPVEAPFQMMRGAITAMKELAETRTILTSETTTNPPDFPSYLVEKASEAVPQVLNFIERKAAAGPGGVAKEEVEKMMQGLGMKMWEGLDKTIKTEVRNAYAARRGQPAPGLPAPQAGAPPGAGAAPPPAQGPAPPTGAPVAAAPGPAPAVVDFPGGAPAAPSGGTTAATPGAKPLDEQYRGRVKFVLSHLLNEMQLGVLEMHWPEQAMGTLPKDIREKLVEAKDDQEVYAAIEPWGDKLLLDKIWAYLREEHPQHEWYRNWLAQGINWIKEASGAKLAPESAGVEGEPPVVTDQPGS